MKSIPVALQAHYDTGATTKCYLLRMLTKDGDLIAQTSLDVDFVYNPATVDPEGTGDDWGEATHTAANSFSPMRFQMTADLSVDNTELNGWVHTDSEISRQRIMNGLFDFARVRLYRVNYMDPTQGHELVFAGRLGQTTYSRNGWQVEWRSLTQILRQPMAYLYSTNCRKIFGSMPIGTGGEQPEERHPCGKEWVWETYTVTGVDSGEPDRIFTASGMTEATDWYKPGVAEFLTGDNAGKQMDVDTNVGDEVSLSMNLIFHINNGDTFRIRQDCNKRDRIRNGIPGDCKDKHNNLPQFGGEPDIPIADGGTLMVPGAHIRQ